MKLLSTVDLHGDMGQEGEPGPFGPRSSSSPSITCVWAMCSLGRCARDGMPPHGWLGVLWKCLCSQKPLQMRSCCSGVSRTREAVASACSPPHCSCSVHVALGTWDIFFR